LIKLFKRRGFTLIEVLISLVILAIGVLAIASMQITSITGTSFSNSLTQASILAQERLEFLKSLPVSDGRLDTNDYPDDRIVGNFNGSYRTVRNPNYILIRYTVTWVEKGISHSTSFSTVKSR
jgi:prepilin-type N-terminal cleavage/methylation domain-containing protein